MKTHQVSKEINVPGFKRLFPTKEYLESKINPNPRTKEEAMRNKELNKEILQLQN